MELDDALTLLAKRPDSPLDVAEVALLLARDEHPELDVEAYLSELQAMAREAEGYARGNLEARVHGLCRYLFHEMGFRGNVQDYNDPRNSYLDDVLDRRTGIPITLSALTMAIGARLGLHIEGIGLPGHFVLKAVGKCGDVLFDPFHGGRRLTPELCEQLVCQVTGMAFHATPERLKPLPLGLILVRMLTNLKVIYLRSGEFHRAIRVLKRLEQLSPEDPAHRRDLGLSMLRVGEAGKAIDHLLAYLSSASEPRDEENVRQLVEQARSEVARWN
jgi:regulator of sirC expression with transglutaminase-like and TPR domain